LIPKQISQEFSIGFGRILFLQNIYERKKKIYKRNGHKILKNNQKKKFGTSPNSLKIFQNNISLRNIEDGVGAHG